MAAKTATTETRSGKPSLLIQLGLLAALTVGAVGSGWVTGHYLTGDRPEPRGTGSQVNAGHDYDDEPGSDKAAEALHIFRLEPITTNLAGSTDIWVRLELALMFTEEPDPVLAEAVHQDLLAYMRTVKPYQVEGASGFQHLRGDLEERAVLRGEGKIRQILVRTLLFE